ncbi:MAG: amidohydrolase [Tindallia sp. MSAO_Bac2]|nr:MAG: amidohydrolase [Tindallia sp. MSAO_Bac2]
MKQVLQKYLKNNKQNIENIWRTLHSMPEKAFEEHRTSKYLGDKLEEMGFLTVRGIGGTGLTGTYDTGIKGPVVGIRADMDALEHSFPDGNKMQHTCGHDANCAMVLGAAESMSVLNLVKRGKLKIIFQPAEETLDGAREMINSGELSDLDYLLGIHLRPEYELVYGQISPSVMHSAKSSVRVLFGGKESHASRMDLGVNAAEVASMSVVRAGMIHFDPRFCHSAKATKISSDNKAGNVVPSRAEIEFDLRSESNEHLENMEEKLMQTLEQTAESFGATANFDWSERTPAARNYKEIQDLVRQAITELVGNEGVASPIKTTGAEDFHLYAERIEGLQSVMLGIGADVNPGLHMVNMEFNQEVLVLGAQALALSAMDIFDISRKE